MHRREKESFWNPSKPINYGGQIEPSLDRSFCYKVAAGTVLVTWLIAIGSFLGWDIPPFLAGKWPWWGFVVLFVVGIPVSLGIAFLGFGWLGTMSDFFTYLERDTWEMASRIKPDKPGLAARWLFILQTVVFLPLILMAMGWISKRGE